ncbi:MAG: JmjC domain-containing protein [Bacteriovorax sp.]
MKILNELLKEHSLETFLSKNFTRFPFSLPHNASPFKSYLDWKVVQTAIEQKKSVLRIVRDGVVTKDHADCSFDEARRFHQAGHTLLLRYAEKSVPALKELADDFSQSFRTEVDIQLYCTPEGHNAFGWHYDIEEVFILQTKGSKEYTIRPNTVHPKPLLTSIPKDLQYEKEKGEVFIQVLLEEGDWLYIPSGWWHVARTKAESMHISVGLMPRSALDVLHFLPVYLTQNSYWRSRLPIHKNFATPADEVSYYMESMQQLGSDLRFHFSDPAFILEFLSFVKNKKD